MLGYMGSLGLWTPFAVDVGSSGDRAYSTLASFRSRILGLGSDLIAYKYGGIIADGMQRVNPSNMSVSFDADTISMVRDAWNQLEGILNEAYDNPIDVPGWNLSSVASSIKAALDRYTQLMAPDGAGDRTVGEKRDDRREAAVGKTLSDFFGAFTGSGSGTASSGPASAGAAFNPPASGGLPAASLPGSSSAIFTPRNIAIGAGLVLGAALLFGGKKKAA